MNREMVGRGYFKGCRAAHVKGKVDTALAGLLGRCAHCAPPTLKKFTIILTGNLNDSIFLCK